MPVPEPLDVVRKQLPDSPPPLAYTWHASEHPAVSYDGGAVKTIDVTDFPETTLGTNQVGPTPGTRMIGEASETLLHEQRPGRGNRL